MKLAAPFALSVLLIGCSSIFGIGDTEVVSVSTDGGAADADPDAPYCQWPLAPYNFVPCTDAPRPTGALTLAGGDDYRLDTTTRQLTGMIAGEIPITTADIALDNGTPALLVSTTSFVVEGSATLTVVGDKALIIMAEGTEGQSMSGFATVLGDISVAAYLDGGIYVDGPAGGLDPECTNRSSGRDPTNKAGGGGGGGGGFGQAGGTGGTGGGNEFNSGGTAGAISLNVSLEILRGGCPGGNGADWNDGGIALAGGAGGAIQIAARDMIRIEGTIDAGGGGGRGGFDGIMGGTGAGGGGSGGGILLDAPVIEVASSGKLCANGGSGGEGGSNSLANAAEGLPGTCADSPADPTEITGNAGGAAGNGGYRSSPDGTSGVGGNNVAQGGGGGGGGSVGVIHMHTTSAPSILGGAVITPTHLLDLP